MEDQWFYGQDGVQRGPLNLEGLRALANTGGLRPLDLVWKQGMAEWEPASKVLPELFAPPAAAATPEPAAHHPPYVPTPPQPIQPMPPANAPLGYAAPMYDGNAQNGRAVTALVLGILSMPSCVCPLVGIPFGIAAIVLGTGVKGGPNRGLAIAGAICGGVGLLLNLPYGVSLVLR